METPPLTPTLKQGGKIVVACPGSLVTCSGDSCVLSLLGPSTPTPSPGPFPMNGEGEQKRQEKQGMNLPG